MKKTKFTAQTFALLLTLPLTANAVCFKTFTVTGIGTTPQSAQVDADEKAKLTCGEDDHNWSSRRSEYSYMEISHEEFSATANFQCCSSW